ncbi:MAG: FGGY-family carbohydrate kinase [Candidatus Omnitrophota bacterium]
MRSDPIVLGIDFGTTELKVSAFEPASGRKLRQEARRLPVRALPHGGREQNLIAVDKAFQECVDALRQQFGKAWGRLAGVGLAAQGGSSIVAVRTTGRPLTPMILWNDGRTQAYSTRLGEQFDRQFWRKFSLFDVPPHGLARLLWMKETHPDYFQEKYIHIGAGEYLFFRLTGVWRQDPGNAIQMGSYNAVNKQLDSALFDSIGVPLSFVAPLRQGHETAPLSEAGAQRLGTEEGIPVAGPYIDQEAGYMSAAGVNSRPLQCSLGTAWVGNFVLPDKTGGTSPFQLVLPSPIDEGRLVVQPLLTGNAVWEWGLQRFIDSNREKALEIAKKTFEQFLLPPEGLTALPWFSQSNPLQQQVYGGGAFFGLSDQAKAADCLRALAAAMTFELARVFDAVIHSGVVDCAVLGGGASKGPFFRRLIAALFAPLPVYWQTDENLAAARGAIYPFCPKTAKSHARQVDPPNQTTMDATHRQYQQYLALFEKYYQSVPAGGAFRFTGRKK